MFLSPQSAQAPSVVVSPCECPALFGHCHTPAPRVSPVDTGLAGLRCEVTGVAGPARSSRISALWLPTQVFGLRCGSPAPFMSIFAIP